MLRRTVPLLAALACTWGADDPLPFPNMAPTIGKFIESIYYDPGRFKPKTMVERALRNLETAEITIDTRWVDQRITVAIKDAETTIPAADPVDLDQAMLLIEAVRKIIDGSTFPADRRRELAYVLINGALSSLDPHTVLMSPEPAKDFGDSISGEFFGIGAYLTQDDGVIAIERVMPGLPAERGGVEDGDVILAIDGEKSAGLSLEQAVRRIKGPKGTQVTLTLERRAANRTLDLAITRDLVQVITMRSFRRGDIGYVRMDEFNNNTMRDLRAAVEELLRGEGLKALVLDLRFNGGGLLEQAKGISELFLSRRQEIVRTVTVDGTPSISFSSARNPYTLPLAVLTSGGSASAAEILAGALQRNDRAVVFGSTTFGKGSVQSIRQLVDGSRLKLTIQEYQLPGGVSIQDVGVTPDVSLIRHSLKKDGTLDRLRSFSREREVDDEFALGNRSAYKHEGTWQLGWVSTWRSKEELKQSGISAREFAPDQEAGLVIDLMNAVAAAPDFQTATKDALKEGKLRQYMLTRLGEPVQARAETEAKILGAALAKQTPPVPWGEGSQPKPGTLQLTYTGPTEVAPLGIDQPTTADLTFTVTNSGTEPVGRLFGSVQADKFSPLWEDEVPFGTIAPGATITGVLHFQVPPRLYSGEERFTLDLRADGLEQPLTSTPVTLNIRAQPRPHLGFDWQLEEPAELKPGVQSFLTVTVRNHGAGPAAKPVARIFKSDDAFVQLGDTRFEYRGKDAKSDTPQADLPAGGEWQFKVPVTISETIKGQPFKANHITLQFSAQETFGEDVQVDSRYRNALFTTLTIPVGEKLKPRSVRAPSISVAKTEPQGSNQVALSVTVEDDNPKFITVFLNEDKVELRTIADQRAFRFPLALAPGANNVRVVVTDQDEVDQVLPIRLWGSGTPLAKKPVITQAAPTSEVP